MKFFEKYLLLFFLAVSFSVTLTFLGLENLYFNNVDWLYSTGDVSNAQNGWIFFKNDKWYFPLGKSPNYGLEIGTSIIFSDSIPLFAFFFKIFKNFLADNFQYFSLWIFICFFLQIYIAYLIILKLTKNTFFSILSSFIFLIVPILIYRISFHMTLGGQWIILLAIYLNLIENKKKEIFYWIVLLVLSTLIHLYFTVMLFVMFFAFLFQKFLEEKNFINIFLNLIFSIFIVLIFMYIFGYFETPVVSTVSRGYGEFKLDLLSIFDPKATGAPGPHWSTFLKDISGTTSEGFNYFGLGNIFIIFLSIIAFFFNCIKKKDFNIFFRKYIKYFIIILVFSLWSLTTNLSYGGNEIFNVQLNDYIFGGLSIFAATGRLFWPAYYLLIIFSIVIIFKSFRINYAFAVLFLSLIIQLVDTSPGFKYYFTEKKHLTPPTKVKNNIWYSIPNDFEKFRTTYLYHNYGNIFSSLSHYLGTSGIKKTDIVLVAGMDRSKAASVRYNFNNSLFEKKLPNDTAYVVDNLGHLKQIKLFLEDLDYGLFFRDNMWLVLPGKKAEMNPNDLKEISKIKFNKININEKYHFSFDKREEFLGVGWSHNANNQGVWSEGDLAFILFSLKNINKEKLKVKLNLNSYIENNKIDYNVKIFFNNILKKNIILSNIKNNENIIFDIQKNEIKDQNVIMLKFNNLISPLDIFKSPDARKLGVLLSFIEITS